MILLAVLPLQQGPTSDAYVGLGAPLAGMLVADLSQVEGITLVERTQLDALQAEIQLGTTGAIDPTTAIEAGRLLGADHVVIGSYSVVVDTLALEARIVEVATGTIREAAEASGPVNEFITVEDRLAEQLVPDLGGTWSQPAPIPTESFGAFAAYGKGLAQLEAGEKDAAAESWSHAVTLDPDYQEARSALVHLRIDLATRQEARVDDAKTAWTANRERVVAEVPSELEDHRKHGVEDLAAFGVRLHALKQLDRHCERYAEMVAYVEKHGLPKEPSNSQDEDLRLATEALWVGWGIVDSEVKAHRSAWKTTPTLWRSPTHYLFDLSDWATDEDIAGGDGLLSSLHACFPDDQRLDEVDRIRDLVADPDLDFDSKGLPLDDAMQLHAAWTAADTGRLDPARSLPLDTLVKKHAFDPKLAKWVDSRIGDVLTTADWYERDTLARLGLSDDVLWGLTHAIAAQDAELLVTDTPTCAEVMRQKQPMAQTRVDQLAEGHIDSSDSDLLWTAVGATRELGCVRGVPARFESGTQVYAYVRDAPSRARLDQVDRCAATLKEFDDKYAPDKLRADSTYEGMDALQAVVAWDDYYRALVLPLCVNEQA
ncbi:MAG: hypothetical protein GY913_11035 [Proteobacteria bacterium]|nr:hypothetical protein [Pseudomonadota bacterium]